MINLILYAIVGVGLGIGVSMLILRWLNTEKQALIDRTRFIKFIHFSEGMDDDMQERFVRIFRAIKVKQHRNVLFLGKSLETLYGKEFMDEYERSQK